MTGRSVVFCVLATAAFASEAADPAAMAVRPNFVFMLADDWGWGDVGAYGANGQYSLTGTNTRTPTLDALARNGTLFTDFHTGQAFCAPSRTSFMTGRYPADLSVNSNWNVGATGAEQNHAAGLPYQLPTPAGDGASPWAGGLANVATLLQANGYYTAHYGKWHLGGCSPAGRRTPAPSEYGFNKTGTYGSPVEAGCVNTSATDEFASKMSPGGKVPDQWWSADVGDYIRDSGIAAMKTAIAAGQPFYLNLWWHMSHDTIDPRPEQYNTTFPFESTCLFPTKAACAAETGGAGSTKGCGPCNWQVFWGAQTYSDMHRFSGVIAAIDELGVRDNTYVIFSSDNGAQGERWTSNKGGSGPDGTTSGAFSNAVGTQGPFRGCKASLYEGGHRVPFIVSGPNVPRGRVDHSLLGAVDFLPTIAALAGVAVPPVAAAGLRGVDISDVLHGKVSDKINRSKALLWRGGGGPAPCWNRSPGVAARNGNWKLLLNGDGSRTELYDMDYRKMGRLNGAFFEAQDHTGANPDVVAALKAEIVAWTAETACPFGAKPGTCTIPSPPGCGSYPFPGVKS